MASIKGNIILNGINTVTGMLFPMATFPYAARILMPEGIGAVNFLNSVVGYIILLTSLGIPMYAVKEIAKYRDDKPMRDKITLEIIVLSTALCFVGYIAVAILAEFVPQIHRQQSIFFILSLSILFTSLGVNWFYQAIEDFKFITIRAIVVRTLAAAALFVFVKNPADLWIYALIIVGSTVGNNAINFVHLRKHITIGTLSLRQLEIKRHLAPALQLFILNLIVSLYVQLNSVMLGLMSNDDEVGYFTAGTKITHIVLQLISSLGIVLLPRCSNLLQNGDRDGFTRVITKSLNTTLLLSLPMCVGLILLATPVTMVFCGEDYNPAIWVLILNSPVIVFIGVTNVLGIQILYPMDKTNLVIISVAVGAIANLGFNFILIPSHGALGAAISTLIAEFAVLLTQILIGRGYFPFKIKALFNIKYIVATIIMALSVIAVVKFVNGDLATILIATAIGAIVYITMLLLMKDQLTLDLINGIKHKIKK